MYITAGGIKNTRTDSWDLMTYTTLCGTDNLYNIEHLYELHFEFTFKYNNKQHIDEFRCH